MKVINEITAYNENGEYVVGSSRAIVESVCNKDWLVKISHDGKSIIVGKKELLKAIENATNVV